MGSRQGVVKPYRVLILGWSASGGAGRAMQRLHTALNKFSSPDFVFDLRVIVGEPEGPRSFSGAAKTSWWFNRLSFIRWQLRRGWKHYLLGRPSFVETISDVATGMRREIENLNYDLVNLHWLGNRTISIQEIGALQIPTVFTLHDMWPLLETEHYVIPHGEYEQTARVTRHGRRVTRLKNRHFPSSFFIAPSNWMKEEAEASPRTRNDRIIRIPNPVDTEFWAPRSVANATQQVGQKPDRFSLAFGFSGGGARWRKGGDLAERVVTALGHRFEREDQSTEINLTLFGDAGWASETPPPPNVSVNEVGELDDLGVRSLLRDSDALLLTSRIDNLPQVGTEAQSCGVPVFGFQSGGISDVVENGVTGFLVEDFDTDALSDALFEHFLRPGLLRAQAEAARERAVRLWQPDVVARQYVEFFHTALDSRK